MGRAATRFPGAAVFRAMLMLVGSMYYSIRDITVSLAALELEVSDRVQGELHAS